MFSELLTSFLKSTFNFEHCEKKMTLIAYVFPKLWMAKNVVMQMSKESRFSTA